MKKLTRYQIKLIAVIAMTLNHIAEMFLPRGGLAGSLMKYAGYITAVIMCYFLTEGMRHTASQAAYRRRLLVLAVISQLPFSLAFLQGSGIFVFSMGFTLYICSLICTVRMKRKDRAGTLLCILLILLTAFSDWPLLAGVFTMLFLAAGEGRMALRKAFLLCAASVAAAEALTALEAPPTFGLSLPPGVLPFVTVPAAAVLSGGAIVFAGFLILCCYSGREGKKSRLSQYLFYLYYPAHLLVLVLIRSMLR